MLMHFHFLLYQWPTQLYARMPKKTAEVVAMAIHKETMGSKLVVIVKNDNEEAADANTNSAPARLSLNYAALLAMALCILPALVL